jgi:hypothetical protein
MTVTINDDRDGSRLEIDPDITVKPGVVFQEPVLLEFYI